MGLILNWRVRDCQGDLADMGIGEDGFYENKIWQNLVIPQEADLLSSFFDLMSSVGR